VATRQAVRVLVGLFSAVTAVGAVVSGLRGAWIASLLLTLASAYFAASARARSARPQESLTRRDALATLGLAEGASAAEIRAAHRRLIRDAHPDRGGSSAQAARLNAARDRLLRP
jgi:hypothetical protein